MLHATQHCHATLARVPSWEQRLPLWELCGCCSVGHSINMSAEFNGHLKSESDISMISFLSHSSNHHLHSFHHFNFIKLRKTFQFELIRLIQEAGGLKKPEEKNRLYKDHPKGFYVYAKFKSNDNDSNNASSNKNSKDIQGCVNYFIRYAGRPAMAENRITEYNKESKTVSWFYNDHKDEKRHDVTDNVIDFINRLIIHIPDYHFLTTRYYGFYANASKKTLDKVHALLGIKKNKDYSRETRTKALKNKLNKLKYRTHLIDSFNRDPIQCKCGAIMQYTYTYNPLEDKRNDRTYRKRCIDEMYKMRLRRRST